MYLEILPKEQCVDIMQKLDYINKALKSIPDNDMEIINRINKFNKDSDFINHTRQLFELILAWERLHIGAIETPEVPEVPEIPIKRNKTKCWN